MAARCFVDSCGITWSEVVTGSGPAFSAAVKLGETLECTEDAGLDVNLLNDVAADVLPARECANILQKDNDGQLHAVIPQAISADYINLFRGVADTADINSPSASSLSGATVTNTNDCESLLIVKGQFQLVYGITNNVDAGNVATSAPVVSLVPFNAQFAMFFSIDGVKRIVNKVAASGNIIDIAAQEYQSDWRDFVYMTQMSAGQVMVLDDGCYHDGPSQRFNVTAQPASQGSPTRGFRAIASTMILPIGVI